MTGHTPLDESNAPVAQQMKAEIRRRIAQGWTKQQILDEMVANFGPGVLSTPIDGELLAHLSRTNAAGTDLAYLQTA